MKHIELKNYELWKECNKEFTKLDYLFGVIINLNIHPDFLLLFSQLFFPNFLLRDDMIFIDYNFNEDYFKRLVSEKNDPKKIEYWMNLIIVSSFFPDDSTFDKHADFLCEAIKKSLSYKLEKEFQNNKFNLITGYDEDDGYYFTFHQECN